MANSTARMPLDITKKAAVSSPPAGRLNMAMFATKTIPASMMPTVASHPPPLLSF